MVRTRKWLWIILFFSGLGVGGAIPVLAQHSGHSHEGYEPAGRFPHSVVVADFNTDGHLDMAIAGSAERKIT
ncbi:MAG: FG-GAP repeat domain-containing protein, partial [Candidatus Methylomirabilales bacterium]